MAKVKDWTVTGQLNLFEYMAEMPTKTQLKKAENVLAFKDRKDKILSDADEYLKRGERLTSLAKEKYEQMIKHYALSDIEEKLFSINLKGYSISYEVVPKIATTIVRPLLRSLTTFDENDEALKTLKALVDYDISIRPVDLKGESYRSAVSVLKRLSDKQICFTLKEERYNPLVVYGLQLNAHPKKRKNILFRDESMCGDIAEIIAWLICFTQYNRALVNDELRPAIKKALYGENRREPMALFYSLVQKDARYIKDAVVQQNFRTLLERHPAHIGVTLQKYQLPSETAIDEFCKTFRVEPDAIIRDHLCSNHEIHTRNRLQINADGSPYMYLLTSDLDLVFNVIDPLNWIKTERGKLCYQDFLNKYNGESLREQNDPDFIPIMWSEPSNFSGIKSCIYDNMSEVLKLVFHNYKEKVTARKYLRENKSRAKVFQTKKNIPEKVVNMMQLSALNDYFGYVEFDEECDLEKVQVIVDQFIAFKETYLKNLDTQKVSIRFRKLGNYKAAGLYFPHLGCLCVDFRHPDSFIHEFGHCIDNVQGKLKNLSEQEEFFNTWYLYKEAFIQAFSDSGKVLTGKYDQNYYLQKTEVFARCFELYVTRTLLVSNSICKPDAETSFAYPKDEELMDAINAYFDSLFEKIGKAQEAA